ncbi:MAG TPA: hypothetical protein VEQ63_08935 [Bryobacteraceae bacterium]|nr:hypothetical protein [Bryobacteraceae bacterium]
MKALVLIACLMGLAAQTPPQDMQTIHKAKGVIIQAAPAASWCSYGPVRLEQARLEPEPAKGGKPPRPLTAREKAMANQFLTRLNSDLSASFAPLTSRAGSGPGLVVIPKVRRLSRNNPWLNVIGFAAMQSPLKGSGITLELALTDSQTQKPVGAMLLVSKGFLASQVDLDRYRYAMSRLGQAQAIAKARGREAAKQLDRLVACDPRPFVDGGKSPVRANVNGVRP